MATREQLKELGRLVARSEIQTGDPGTIDALGKALDLALTLIPGWKDAYIEEGK